jgi:plasmid stabilization system protein ParE
MTHPIVIRRSAQADFAEAAEWIAKKSVRLARAFTLAVQQMLDDIQVDPLRYPEVYPDTREVVILGFSYVIYYKIEGNTVVVYSVFHTSRDPAVWQARVGS